MREKHGSLSNFAKALCVTAASFFKAVKLGNWKLPRRGTTIVWQGFWVV